MTTEADLYLYLDNLLLSRPDLLDAVEALRLIWKLIQDTLGAYPLPSIGPTNDGSIAMSWRKKNYYISIDILDKDSWDWYSRDSEDLTNYEGVYDISLPAKLVEHLKLYQAAK